MNPRLLTLNLHQRRAWTAYRRSLAPLRDYRWGAQLLKRLHASLMHRGVLYHLAPGGKPRRYHVEGE